MNRRLVDTSQVRFTVSKPAATRSRRRPCSTRCRSQISTWRGCPTCRPSRCSTPSGWRSTMTGRELRPVPVTL